MSEQRIGSNGTFTVSFHTYVANEKVQTTQGSTSREQLLDFYRRMLTIRVFETVLSKRYGLLEIRGEMHLSMGHEAVAVGVASALTEDDFVVGTHRSHGHIISREADLRKIAAEIYGKSTGLCKGKGGHMHLTDFSHGFLSSSIVGGGLPIAAGIAYVLKRLRKDGIVVAFTGDGATNQGVFHETLNLASIWHLPIVFVVENNEYAFSVKSGESTSVASNALRSLSYSMDNLMADGRDVVTVFATARMAVEHVRKSGKPYLVEYKVSRLSPHLELIDAEEYRSEEEKRRIMLEDDPLLRLERMLLSEGVLLEEERTSISKEVEDAFRFAEESPLPQSQEAFQDLFA